MLHLFMLIVLLGTSSAFAEDAGIQFTSDDSTSGFHLANVSGDTLFRFGGDGRFGMGIANPEAMLHLCGNTPRLILDNTNPDVGSMFNHYENGVQQAGLIYYGSTHQWGHPLEFAIKNYQPGPIVWYTDNEERLTLDADGRLGVGVTEPQAHVHIRSENTDLRLETTDATLGTSLQFYEGDDPVAAFIYYGTQHMYGHPAEMAIKNREDGPIWFYTQNQPRIAIQSDGDLDMQENEITNMVLENRTSDPASPAVGRIWIRTDQ